MEGSKFHVSMSQRSGASLSNKYIGNAFNVQQVYGGETFKLIDVEYIKRYYDGKLTFHMGRIAAGDDFLTSPYYWIFMQNGIDGNPVGIFKNAPGMSAYPNAAWGARMRIRPTDRTYLLAGVYNGDSTVRDNTDHGLDWSMHGPAFVITEAAYQRNGLPDDKGPLGNYKIGAWYNAGTFTNAAGQVLTSSPSVPGLNSATQQGNWGYYALADQVIWRKPNEKQRNIGVFTSILVSPEEDYNQMPFFCNGGVAWTGPFDSRPTDILGFAIVYGKFSDDLQQAEQLARTFDSTVTVQDYELAFEWCYRFRMRDGALYVQPDFQYIIQPNGSNEIPNAFVVGCQLGLNF
jgi:porin